MSQFVQFTEQMAVMHHQFDSVNKPNETREYNPNSNQNFYGGNSSVYQPLNPNLTSDNNNDMDQVEIDPVMYEQHMKKMLDKFWITQDEEMNVLNINTEQDFKNHNDLPLARIKRIMKSDEDVRMISAEAPVLFAKACELFILEVTLRSWCYSEQSRRKTLQKEDIQTAIKKTDIFDFLIDVIMESSAPSTTPPP